MRLDMKKEKIVLTDWLHGALKGRSSEPWAECIQYGVHLESPKDEKYLVKHLNRRYQSEFGCTVTLRGRRQNEQKRLRFVDASDARKFLVASLYPMKKLTDSNERLQALAAAESHFDATLRDMLQGKHRPSADEETGSVSSSSAVPASALSQPASSEVPWLRSSGAAMGASRMRSKGSRFTLGVWGLRVCSLDVAQPSATVRNRPQPSATVRNRPREGHMAVPMVSSAEGVTFGGFTCGVSSFRVAGVALRDTQTFFVTCRKPFSVAGALLLQRFQKMRCSFHGRRSTLDVVIWPGRRSTLDVSCWVFFANRIVRAASGGDKVHFRGRRGIL